MPRLNGRGMQQLLKTFAELHHQGLSFDGQARLSTALMKALREHLRMNLRRREQRQFLSPRAWLRSLHRQKVAVAAIQNVSAMRGVAPSIVRQFADISAPENAQYFTAEAAHKAFGHLKDKD